MDFMHAVNLGAVDLNLLVVLEALLATRSVTAAARRVGLSQPAASHALARLRALLADPLFVRSGAQLVPTARADALRAPLGTALDTIRQSLAGPAAFDPKTSQRTFALWTADLGEFVLLPPLAAHLAAHAPRIDVAVRPIGAEAVDRLLAEGTLDLALGPGGPTEARFHREALYRESFVCVLRKGHRALRKRWDLDAYCAESHLLVAPRGTPGSSVDTWLATKGKARRVALMIPHFLVAPHVVAASDLVWTAPEVMARAYADLVDVVIRPTPVAMEGFTTVMIWHERHDRDPGHAWLRGAVRAISATAAWGG